MESKYKYQQKVIRVRTNSLRRLDKAFKREKGESMAKYIHRLVKYMEAETMSVSLFHGNIMDTYFGQ